MTLLREYCILDDVKRILRSAGSRESRIRFSESYKDLKAKSDNSGNIFLSGVNFESSFSDHETFTFTFTDSTSFDVVGDVSGDLGSGTIQNTFTATNKFTVPSTKWTRIADTDDEYYITSNSDISDDDADGFIQDARKFINAELARIFGGLDNVSFISDPAEDIPQPISYACMRYASYEIFHSVFAGTSIDEASPVQKWKDMADEAMEKYKSSSGSGPRWKARDSLITELGVPGVGEGEIDIKTITAAKNKDFER